MSSHVLTPVKQEIIDDWFSLKLRSYIIYISINQISWDPKSSDTYEFALNDLISFSDWTYLK